MQTLYAEHALITQNGRPAWQQDVAIHIVEGIIARIDADTPHAKAHPLLLPAMSNVHSHAFQYAMAGLAEHRAGNDNFWSWRETMYRLANSLTPEHQTIIADYLYIQMLKSGYAAVGEFHYLHGANPQAGAQAILHAAEASGIALTLLPVLYLTGDFGQPPAPRQQPFLLTPDTYMNLVTELAKTARVGLAPHSLRAVPEDALRELLAFRDRTLPGCPVHIHAAEQTKEVGACLAHTGKRPVAWLLEQVPVDEHWCLIHATHSDAAEVQALAKSGAVAGLCPSTEANLGDGIFPALDYVAAGGCFGLGTDSHITLNPFDELRLLEYGQRLTHRQRNVMFEDGTQLYHAAALGSAQALGFQGGLQVGADASLLALDTDHPLMTGRTPPQMLQTAIYALSAPPVRHLWVRGEQLIDDGRHKGEEKAAKAFRRLLETLAITA